MVSMHLQGTGLGSTVQVDDELLQVMRGVPSRRFLEDFDPQARTTWFTSLDGPRGAIADASWTTEDDEQAFVELGLVRWQDAYDVRNGFVTIHDPSLVDVCELRSVDRLSAGEMAAQEQAMRDAIFDNSELRKYVDEWLEAQDEDEEDDE